MQFLSGMLTARTVYAFQADAAVLLGLHRHVHGHRTMSSLLHPGESNLFSELRENGYYVWMNDRNDLFAGQIEGWAESNADEIYYCGQVKPAPRAVNGRENETQTYIRTLMGN